MRKAFIFPFIKYIHPIWNFNLPSEDGYALWVNYDLLDDELKKHLFFDHEYDSRSASLRDAAFQALQKGVLCFDHKKSLKSTAEPNLKDNYRFIRKYFGKKWGIIIFLLRLLSFKNPVREAIALYKSRNTPKVDLHSQPVDYSDEISESTQFLSRKPFISIIIPTLSRYPYLKDVLFDLSNQTYKNFEILICDQSDPVDKTFYTDAESDFNIKIKLIVQKEKALWRARNRCIKESKGDFILLFDDDSRVEPNWIENHLRCIENFNADISSGVSLSSVGSKIPVHYSHFRWSDQLDTGNVLIRREVFSKVGLFDRQFEKQRMGDGEFGVRCYLKGITNISNPMAMRIHLKVASGGLRQMGSWDGLRPKKLFAPKPVPSVLYLVRKYFGASTALLMLLLQVPFSIMPYKHKGKTSYTLLSAIVFVLLFPIVGLQVYMSWQKSSKMLKKGALIEYL